MGLSEVGFHAAKCNVRITHDMKSESGVPTVSSSKPNAAGQIGSKQLSNITHLRGAKFTWQLFLIHHRASPKFFNSTSRESITSHSTYPITDYCSIPRNRTNRRNDGFAAATASPRLSGHDFRNTSAPATAGI
jgi:hypothetical protein